MAFASSVIIYTYYACMYCILQYVLMPCRLLITEDGMMGDLTYKAGLAHHAIAPVRAM